MPSKKVAPCHRKAAHAVTAPYALIRPRLLEDPLLDDVPSTSLGTYMPDDVCRQRGPRA